MSNNISIRKKQGDVREANPLPVYNFDYLMYQIREANSFFHIGNFDVSSGDTQEFLIVTPDSLERTYFRFNIIGESEHSIILKEDVTVNSNGSKLDVFNRDRNSVLVNNTEIYDTPLVISGGDVILDGVDQVGDVKLFGDNPVENTLILKANTKYYLSITDESSANNSFKVSFDWFETTPETTSMDA